MKKIVILMAMLTMISIMFAQTLLHEDFSGTQFPPAGWAVGSSSEQNWTRFLDGHFGPGGAFVYSWDSAKPNPPIGTKMFLVTKGITIPADAEANYRLEYFAFGGWREGTEPIYVHWSTSPAPNSGNFNSTNMLKKADVVDNWDATQNIVEIPPAAKGKTIYLAFRYDADEDSFSDAAIDDIRVYKYSATPDMAALGIDKPSLMKAMPKAGSALKLNVKLANYSTAASGTSYTVKLYNAVTDAEITTTSTPKNIPVYTTTGSNHGVVELTWAAPEAGFHEVYVKVAVASDADPTNDQTEPFLLMVADATGTDYVEVKAVPVPASGSATVATHPTSFTSESPVHQIASQIIYTKAEMGAAGYITHIMYRHDHLGPEEFPLELFMKNDAKSDFPPTPAIIDFIAPALFTKVFEGHVNWDNSNENMPMRDLWIELDTPFFYDGTANLVVTTFKNSKGYHYGAAGSGPPRFLAATIANSNRVLNLRSGNVVDSSNYNTVTLGTSNVLRTFSTVPVTHFLKVADDPSTKITGYVKNSSGPIKGASVKLLGTPYITTTDTAGKYEFEGLTGINQGLLVKAAGHTTVVVNTPVTATPADVIMTETATMAVTVTVKAADEGLAGVHVYVQHPVGGILKEMDTISGGVAAFTGVYNDGSELLFTATMNGYEDAYFTAVAPDDATANGWNIVINLFKRALPPVFPRVKEVQTGLEVSWLSPDIQAATLALHTEPQSSTVGSPSWLDYGSEWGFGHRYDATTSPNINSIKGYYIYRLGFPRPSQENGAWTLCVVQSPTAITPDEEGDLIFPSSATWFEYPVLPGQHTSGWNYYDLDTPVKILDTTTELYILAYTASKTGYVYQCTGQNKTINYSEHSNLVYVKYNATYGGYAAAWPITGWGDTTIVAYALSQNPLGDSIANPVILSNNAEHIADAKAFNRSLVQENLSAITTDRISSHLVYPSTSTRAASSIKYNVYAVNNNASEADYMLVTESEPISGQSHVVSDFTTLGINPPFSFAIRTVYDYGTASEISSTLYAMTNQYNGSVKSNVTIKITAVDGTPLQGVKVNVRVPNAASNIYVAEKTTDASGVALVGEVVKGTYEVIISGLSTYLDSKEYFLAIQNTETFTYTLAAGQELMFESFEEIADTLGDPEDGTNVVATLENWLNIDVDGDGYFWKGSSDNLMFGYHGARSINSESFCNKTQECVYPDNWLISPEIVLPDGDTPTFLSFAIRPSSNAYVRENISVYVITERISQESTVAEITTKIRGMLKENTDPAFSDWRYGDMNAGSGVALIDNRTTKRNSWEFLGESLQEFNGQVIRLAFRHWRSSDQEELRLDAVRFSYALEHPAIVKGSVTDGTTGINGAKIELNRVVENVVVLGGTIHGKTDPAGLFEINYVEDDKTYRIKASADGFQPETRNFTMDATAGVYTLTDPIVLQAGKEACGEIIIGKTGAAPVPGIGAKVSVWSTATTPAELFSMIALDATASFSFWLIPGNYTLKVELTGYTSKEIPFEITAEAGIDFGQINLGDPVSDVDTIVIPAVTALTGNYPNPFNPTTTIAFDMARDGNVKIEIFNVKGQKVKTLVNTFMRAGTGHKVVWTGLDDDNKTVGSGVYFYRMQTKDYSSTQKMLLIK